MRFGSSAEADDSIDDDNADDDESEFAAETIDVDDETPRELAA
jgi:hypothetical protein